MRFRQVRVETQRLAAVSHVTGEIAEAFKIGRIGRMLEHRQEIWDAPVIFGLIFVLLCVEWIVRKRVRLI